MNKNQYGGLFVAFDGPNGVGKSTLIEHVQIGLSALGIDVFVTKEPTDTAVGNFTRKIAETLNGKSLTCLVAADRYLHLCKEIIPCLQAGKVVVTDRYLLSSLVLQRMDKVEVEFILAVNGKTILPDLQIIVTADEEIIQSRISEREQLTRFERGNRTAEELRFIKEGKETLSQLGVAICESENSGDLQESVSLIAKRIKDLLIQ